MQGAQKHCCPAMGVEAQSQVYLVEQSRRAYGTSLEAHCWLFRIGLKHLKGHGTLRGRHGKAAPVGTA